MTLLNSKRFIKSARGIIVNKKKNKEQKMFEWKHPNYYKELKKLREEAEKELEKEEEQEQNKEED